MAIHIAAFLLLLLCNNACSLFTYEPDAIIPNETENLVLKCQPKVNDSSMFLALGIKKVTNVGNSEHEGDAEQTEGNGEHDTKEVKGAPGNGNLENHRRRRSSENSLIRVTISSGGKPNIIPAIDRFTAEGNLDTSVYLTVKIAKTVESDLGVYQCEYTYFSTNSGLTTKSEIAEIISAIQPEVNELKNRVNNLETEVPEYRTIMNTVEQMVQEIRQVMEMTGKDVEALKKENKEIVDSIVELTKEVRRVSNVCDNLNGQNKNFSSGGNLGNSSDNFDRPRGDNQAPTENADLSQILLDNTRIQALATEVDELKTLHMQTQEAVAVLQLTMNGKLMKRLRLLELFNWRRYDETMDDLEEVKIPMMMHDIADCKKNIAQLQIAVFKELANKSEEAQNGETITPPTPEEATSPTVPEYNGPACYVCGNNETQIECTPSSVHNTAACPRHRPFCKTDLYQADFSRNIYKSCAPERECKEGKLKSSPECSTDSFMDNIAMECHFCCTTQLCNKDIRPPEDLY